MTNPTESDQAVSLYSKTPKEYNCAQAVVKAFGRDDIVAPLKSCGGGRAEGGLCGALHAALLLLPENKREAMKEQFRDRVGSIFCRTIRQEGKTPCAECVRIAADLVAEQSVKATGEFYGFEVR
jgi:hypothetical protein